MSKVESYERWLYREALSLLGSSNRENWDDVINEGRVAMWKVEQQGHGDHAGFMTLAARNRMRDVAWNNRRHLGSASTSTKGVPNMPTCPSLDSLDSSTREVVMGPSIRDIAEEAMLAYHHGQMAQCIARLSPSEQNAVRMFLADQKMSSAERSAWSSARRKLAEWLEHLR